MEVSFKGTVRRGDSNTRRDGRGAPKDSGSGGSSVAATDRPTGGELGQEGRVARDAPRRHCRDGRNCARAGFECHTIQTRMARSPGARRAAGRMAVRSRHVAWLVGRRNTSEAPSGHFLGRVRIAIRAMALALVALLATRGFVAWPSPPLDTAGDRTPPLASARALVRPAGASVSAARRRASVQMLFDSFDKGAMRVIVDGQSEE